ncbi:YagK/YfjJ domain-containing protein [Aliivibrio fischeri]|uniref:YagK/YfjJ domain-containing protein n=1 Tax=Aliivibrio fischeri TaxID=668 RepID=UPI0007C5A542|nr:inovirus-type Gp2 protein [Aliivibrio fischeri]MBP3141049.1 inovirus-type Gp2 protein [Aliivibrio fischeri]MCE7574151.1 inovirus Gp2 family protein [Aliivibrio fischeri]
MANHIPKLIPNPNNKNLAYYWDKDTYIPVYYRSGLIINIMDAIAKQLSVVQIQHSRVLVGLLQFNLPVGRGTLCNTVMSQFIDRYIPKVKQHYKALGYSTNVGYVWVREQSTSTVQHYHAAFFVNQQAVAGIYKLRELASELWGKLCGGHVTFPANPTYTVKRKDNESRFIALMRLSYYAKEETKNASSYIKNYSTSRLKMQRKSE